MLKIIYTLSDILFPPRPTELLVRSCITNKKALRRKNGAHRGVVYLSDYTDPTIRALILENKYHSNEGASEALAKLLNEWIRHQQGVVTLAPVPLGKQRQKERGYNQVTEILKKVTLDETTTIDTSILRRTRDTVPQTTLEKTARAKNIVGAFECPKPELLHNYAEQTIVLIDDVTTTGATLEVARATLAPLLPPSTTLICLALAH